MGSFNFFLYIASALVIIAVFLGLINIVNHNLTETRESVGELKDIMEQKQSGINITYIRISSNSLDVYVKNTGKYKLSPEKIDVYLDARIPRNDTVIEIMVDKLNPNMIDPNEEIKITVLRGAASNNTYTLTVNDEFGAKDSVEFYYNTHKLTVDGGQYNPDTGNVFTIGDLNAVNNDGGDYITLNNVVTSSNDDWAGLNVSDISLPSSQIEVLIDYTAANIEDNEFKVELRNKSADGHLYCSQSYGTAASETAASLMCLDYFSSSAVDNLYINIINQGDESNEEVLIDYLRINVTTLTII